MSYKTFRLKAGVDLEAPITGKILLVDSTGAADGIDITLRRGGQGVTLPNRQKAFKFVADYDTVILRAAVDCTVGLFLSMTDVSLGFTDTAMLKVSGDVRVTNDGDNPVSVSVVGAAITASDVTLKNDDESAVPTRRAQAKTIIDRAPVAVGVDRVVVISDINLRGLRFRNQSESARIAVGGAGVTFTNAVIVLEPGDMWMEDEAAGAAWHAVADEGGALLAVMGVKA